MERNIGDQLNKAFEAYRQVSIEKDNAKKELQQITDYYQRHTEKLLKQMEEQQLLICQLKAQLSASRTPAVEGSSDSEACNHPPDGTCSHVETQHLDNTAAVTPARPVHGGGDYQDMLGALEAIHGTFRQIRSLSRRQKDQLKRFCGGLEMANANVCVVHRSAVLHAHPVHGPHGGQRATCVTSLPGIARRQPRRQGLCGLSHQPQREVPALGGQRVRLPEQRPPETPVSRREPGPRRRGRGGAHGTARRAFCLPAVPLPRRVPLLLPGGRARTPAVSVGPPDVGPPEVGPPDVR
ncbi:TRAF family member-associated NF-kappa-B activator isoform X3 [Nerophis ophidion]|uniref:TRAF family member-associated NF-kappa-B activator isoform X3 n=1 Tax=Nerophis ophidion TaxID=159077 RepID=UPI002ADFDE5F|nr:TRAF family member-associated NF-kappa-B activator isoform X3 [Nerophis ophidion]